MRDRQTTPEYTTIKVRSDTYRALRLIAEQEQTHIHDVVSRSVGTYLRWRAEQSYLTDRPDLADPATDGVIPSLRVVDMPVVVKEVSR